MNLNTMNKRIREECVCVVCGKTFYPDKNVSGKYCSIKCYQIDKVKKKYQNYLKDDSRYNGRTNMSWVKPHILEEQNHRCDICGMIDIWNHKSIVFILDYIDGHANNNTRSNLRLICPNCDSQLETYKSKNKNSDRAYYHFHHR